MGENANDVHLVGCPAIDIVKKLTADCQKIFLTKRMELVQLLIKVKPFLLVLQHSSNN